MGGTWMLKIADFMFFTPDAIPSIFLPSSSSSTSLGLFQGVWLVYPRVIISWSPSMDTTLPSGLTT